MRTKAGASFLMFTGCLAFAGTPKEALIELAMAKDVATVEKHIPLVMLEHIQKMAPASKKAVLDRMVIGKHFEEQQATLHLSDDGETLFVVGKDDRSSGYLHARREISNGAEAVEEIEFCPKQEVDSSSRCFSGFAIMKLQEGEWRLSEIAGGEGANFEDPKFLASLDAAPINANESSAVGGLRTLNTSIIAYETSFPDHGAPSALGDLGSSGSDQHEPSPDHAMLVDQLLSCKQSACVKSGYAYQYNRLSKETYVITARPVKFGDTGTRSFFTDESGVIRSTGEDREPTVKDPPI
jgi:hypothetical protein